MKVTNSWYGLKVCSVLSFKDMCNKITVTNVVFLHPMGAKLHLVSMNCDICSDYI